MYYKMLLVLLVLSSVFFNCELEQKLLDPNYVDPDSYDIVFETCCEGGDFASCDPYIVEVTWGNNSGDGYCAVGPFNLIGEYISPKTGSFSEELSEIQIIGVRADMMSGNIFHFLEGEGGEQEMKIIIDPAFFEGMPEAVFGTEIYFYFSTTKEPESATTKGCIRLKKGGTVSFSVIDL